MRVSKADGSQTVDLQRDALPAEGIATARLYEDRTSGRNDDRPGLTACLKSLRDGDTLVAWKLDRLGRNLHHLVNTVHDLTAWWVNQCGVPLNVEWKIRLTLRTIPNQSDDGWSPSTYQR